jgi:hypothetical protein
MEFIKRYFKTVEEANTFIQQINNALGIPVNETATTRTYTEYQTDEDGIYVDYETYIGELLGEPIEITI